MQWETGFPTLIIDLYVCTCIYLKCQSVFSMSYVIGLKYMVFFLVDQIYVQSRFPIIFIEKCLSCTEKFCIF